MKRYISWSGGKDSTASIILCYEKGIPIDGVVMSEVMFDNSRGISGENPKHIKWIYETAIPIIENEFGYKVFIVRDKSDYMQEFHAVIRNSKHPDRNGKKRGFFIGGMCAGNDRLKMRPLRKFFKEVGECEQIVGIAADEPERLIRLKEGRRSVLAENNIIESMTYNICKKYNLLSPTYADKTRGGCWFCPNQSIKELATLKKEYQQLWEELREMAKTGNLASKYFKWGQTFAEVEKQVDLINNQITIFELVGGDSVGQNTKHI